MRNRKPDIHHRQEKELALKGNRPLSDAKTLAEEEFPVAFRAEPSDPRVQRVLNLFQANLDRPLRIHDLAQSVLLSRSRFGYLFRRETASSPARLLKSLRLMEARRILAGSDLSVKQVAARVGMNDLSHFVRDVEFWFKPRPLQKADPGYAGSKPTTFHDHRSGNNHLITGLMHNYLTMERYL